MKELFIEMICDADFKSKVREVVTIETMIKIWEDEENGNI